MTTRTRDSLALYLIAALAVLVTLYGDMNFGALFQSVLAHW